jgi:hypothetical protein
VDGHAGGQMLTPARIATPPAQRLAVGSGIG